VARLTELPWKHRLFLASYRFRRLSPVPWAPLRRPVTECRVALATSAGLYLPDQPPFDPDIRGGDPSFRVIPLPPAGVALGDLGLRHSQRSEAFDPSGIEKDWNLALPLDRLRELEATGEIGSAAPRHLSFMGSITTPGRLRKESTPRAVDVLLEDGVEALLLCPV
jgi:D-proline reductase (dithiol) PrdB